MLKLDIFTPKKTSGGGHTFTTHIHRALSERGHDVRTVHDTKRIRNHSYVLAAGTRAPKVPNHLAFWPLTVAPLEPETRHLLARTPKAMLHWNALRVILGKSCDRADSLLFSSSYARTLYARAFPRATNIPTTICHPSPTPTSQTYERSPIGETPEVNLLSVSHLYRYKLPHNALLAASLLRRRTHWTPNLSFAGAVPDQQYARQLISLVDHLDLNDHVSFLGAVPPARLDTLYREADVFVFTSTSENAASYALLDAMAHGVPIVSSYESSITEVAQDAVLYANPRDPQDIALRISDLLNSIDKRLSFSERARARARELPSWSQAARIIEDHFTGSNY